MKILSPLGEWVSDRRKVYGISEYIDGSRYVGSWKEDERDGYGTLLHGNFEASGKWRNDVLLSNMPKKGISLRSPRMRTKVRISFDAATEAAKLAAEKCKTVLSRSATARKIAESAKMAADKATKHASIARLRAEQFDIQLADSRKLICISRYYFEMKQFVKLNLVTLLFPQLSRTVIGKNRSHFQ